MRSARGLLRDVVAVERRKRHQRPTGDAPPLDSPPLPHTTRRCPEPKPEEYYPRRGITQFKFNLAQAHGWSPDPIEHFERVRREHWPELDTT